MAKKIVRGITDVKTITNQDFDTNNVNDLLSDGQYSYIHRKKGKSEEYHNLTDNIKTISSDNTELLTVTNNNKTTNSATLHPKHDAQKEQVLQSTRNTVTIQHGTNGTPEKTNVDTNPAKVLEHTNLFTDYGISKTTTGNTTKLGLEYTRLDITQPFDLNNLRNGCVQSNNFINGPTQHDWYLVSAYTDYGYTIQEATDLVAHNNRTFRRVRHDMNWGEWREKAGDKSIIDAQLSQKQNKLTAMGGISITGDSISLTAIDQYNDDLNNLNYTCLVKPTDDAPNLPTSIGGNGILTVVRIGDVVSQKYHLHDNTMYARAGRRLPDAPSWTPWVKVPTTPLS